MIVVDTNILSYFFLNTVYSEKAVALYRKESIWYAPYLWRNEFRNVLALYLRKGSIALEDAIFIIEKAELSMEGNEFYVTSQHILTLVNISNCSAYDCEFVALAQQLNANLLTEDKKIISEFKDIAVNLDTFLS